MSVSKAAAILVVRRATLSDLLNGKASLSAEMALRTEKAFSPTMEHLFRMQAAYDAAQQRLREEQITDEVIAYERWPFTHLGMLETDMTAAISAAGHDVVDVRIHQKEDRLIIHGIYQVKTQEVGDIRGRILRDFLERRRDRATASAQSEIHPAPELLGEH